MTFAEEPGKIPKLTTFVHCQVATGMAIRDVVQLERSQIADSAWLRLNQQRDRPTRAPAP